MTRIFISYRQEDSGGYSSQLCQRLQDKFGEAHVFFDIESIELGADWWQVVEEKIKSCEILLAPIGLYWLTVTDKKGRPRLGNPKDPLRREIETALREGLRIIPLLVGGATMPEEDQLPGELQKFARCNAWELRHASFDRDVEALIERLGGATPAGRPEEGEKSDDFLSVLGKSFAAKLGERLAGGGSPQASPAPAPTPAYVPSPAINLSGTWQSMTGVPHMIWQQGNVITIESRNQFGIVVMRGQGTLTGNQLYVVYEATYQPPYVVRGEARCMVSPDGMLITGQSVDQAVGMQPVQIRRVG